MPAISLTFFVVYICHWMSRISTTSPTLMWGSPRQRHSSLNKDSRVHYQGLGCIFQIPETGTGGMSFQLPSTFSASTITLGITRENIVHSRYLVNQSSVPIPRYHRTLDSQRYAYKQPPTARGTNCISPSSRKSQWGPHCKDRPPSVGSCWGHCQGM